MPYTVEDYKRELQQEILAKTPHEELLRLLTPEERVAGLTPEELVNSMSPEERAEVEALLARMRSGQS